MSALSKLKTMLHITDTTQDILLGEVLAETEQRLSTRFLGGVPVPDDLEYVVVAVSVIRFNRIGSEGMEDQSTDSESLSFIDDDFAPYKDDIAQWLSFQDGIKPTRGRVRFI